MFLVLKAIITGFFNSLWGRFFPAKTASDEKADELQAEVKSLLAEAKARELIPTSMEALIKEQQDGKV